MLEQLTFRIFESDGQVICRNCFHVIPINYFVIFCLFFQYNVVFKIVAVDAICKLRFLFCLLFYVHIKNLMCENLFILSDVRCCYCSMERRSLSAALQLSILKFEISSEPSCAWERPKRNPFNMHVLILKIL